MAIQTTKLSEVEVIQSAIDPKLVIEDEGEIKRISPEAIAPSQVQADWEETDVSSPAYILNKPESLGSSGGFMEVDIVLSSNNFYDGTVAFSKTYDEIKSAIDSGYFVIGWIRNQAFTGAQYQYHAGYLRPTFPKYAPDINGGTISFIFPDADITSFTYIQADGTTGVYFD